MINTIGVIGAGAVGGMLISRLYPTYNENFYLLASSGRAERLQKNGVSVNDCTHMPQICSSPSQDIRLDLLIVTVKSYSLDAAIEDIRPLIRKETILLPLLNGITATDRLRQAFPDNTVLYGTILRTDAHREGGRTVYSVPGELLMGTDLNSQSSPEVAAVRECLVSAGINANIYEDMRLVQWKKWMLNTGAGQAAVMADAECGYFARSAEILEMMRMCMDEILLLARAENVGLTVQHRDETIELLKNYPPHKKMSILQDIEAGRPTELEEYAGMVMRLGQKHGIPTPINHLMYLSITAKEKISKLKRAGN